MKKFEIGKDYFYTVIKQVVNESGGDLIGREMGDDIVGKGFIVVEHLTDGDACSFMLVSTNKSGFIYKCIYNDWKK